MKIASLGTIIAAFLLLSLDPAAAAEKKSASEGEFCRLDRNNDRGLTFEEFKACEFHKLEHLKQLPYGNIEQYDRDKNGSLSDDEMQKYLFDRADKNKDRRIDRKEWEEFYGSIMSGQ
jgi:hypothetical protein